MSTIARTALGTLLALTIPGIANAQSIAIKGGLAYGNVSNSDLLAGNLGARTGFAAGIGVSASGGLLGLGVDALYTQRGVTSSTDADSRALDYLDVPVYLRVTAPTPLVSPFAYAGPYVSFELRCRSGSLSCVDTGRAGRSFGAVIGAGARISRVSLEGRFLYGFTDLHLSTVTSAETYRSRTFLVLVGIGL